MTTGASTVGVLRIGPARVAVTLRVLREVLPAPEQLEPFPAAGTALLGAVNVRGSVVPVLDLRLLLGWPAERNAEQIVTVLSREEGVIGLLCDEVMGVAQLEATTLQRLADAEDDLLFSHSFEHPEDGRIVSLLDVERLLTLPGVPAAQPPTPTTAPAAATATTAGGDGVELRERDAGTELVVFRCGQIRFGLDVARVHALLPKVDLTGSPLVGPLCIGVTGYDDRSIPAVPLLRLVGLESAEDGLNGGLIVRYPEVDGYVTLLLSEVIEIVRVSDGDLLELPAVLAAEAAWFQGLAALPGIGDVLILDADRLSGDQRLATLAALNTAADGSTSVGGPVAAAAAAAAPADGGAGRLPAQRSGESAQRPTGIRYLTYSAGRELATPLLQVSEILTYPEVWTPINRPESGLLGVFTHRGVVVPLVCLTTLVGEPAPEGDPTEDDRRVVIVTVPTGTVGFIVPVLRAIEESTWEEAPSAAPPADEVLGPVAALAISHVIRVGSDANDRNVRTADLAAVATALTTHAADPVGSF